MALAVVRAQPTFPPPPRYKPTIGASHPVVRAIPPGGDAVARLAARLARGDLTLPPEASGDARLAAVLAALEVSPESQVLVFSRTSVQAAHISPSRPRAVYFADDVYVAHVPGTPDVEIIAVDPLRGPRFYELADVAGPGVPATTEACLRCHHGPNTAGVPGVYVGSVVPGPSGAPLRDDSAIITDLTTPFWERWGGWYVTAGRGEPRTRANAVASSPNAPDALVREVPRNIATLHHFLDPRQYLRPTSDVVALLVLEHQTQVTNLLTRVAWQARLVAAGVARADAPDGLDHDVADLVDALCFAGEEPLPAPLEGSGEFARAFAARARRDADGRSLRDFDLSTRLFRYPLSYLVDGAQFRALPAGVRADVLARLRRVLSGELAAPRYEHLTPEVRTAIRAVARATMPDLAAEW